MTIHKINKAYESLTHELLLVQDFLKFMTEFEINDLDTDELLFKITSSDILSQYQDLKDYNLGVIDLIIQQIKNSPFDKVYSNLKALFKDFIDAHQQQIGVLIIFGSLKRDEYKRYADIFKDNMLAFLRDLCDRENFSIWYVDTRANFIHGE